MQITHSYTRCNFGVATRDVTPPVGIYARSWGAATHEVAEGVHRPFAATAAVFAPLSGDGPTLALVAVDLGWFQYIPDEQGLRATILERTGLDDEALLINMSHTHAGANVNSQLTDKPGADLIEPYIEHLTEQIGSAIVEAQEALAPAWVTYGAGRCALADQPRLLGRGGAALRRRLQPGRDLPTTRCVVARVTGEDGGVLATVFNYACHPTTLAWENKAALARLHRRGARGLGGGLRRPGALPPGRFGRARAARRLRRRHGRRGPQRTPARARRRGGDRGAAAAGDALRLHGYRRLRRQPRHMGASADARPSPPASRLAARVSRVPLRRKEELGVVESLSAPDSVQEQEKALRRRFLSEALGDGPVYEMPVWTWRLGDALLVAIPNEPYSVLQVELRRRFAGTPLLVLGVTNRTMGYLSPAETYGTGLYQEQQSPFAPGCLEQTIEVAASALDELRP